MCCFQTHAFFSAPDLAPGCNGSFNSALVVAFAASLVFIYTSRFVPMPPKVPKRYVNWSRVPISMTSDNFSPLFLAAPCSANSLPC